MTMPEGPLQAAIANLSLSAADRTSAERALRRMSMPTTDEAVEIYIGLKSLKPGGRIKAHDIHKHTKKEVVGTSEISVTVWIIHKADFPYLAQKVAKKFLKGPSTLKTSLLLLPLQAFGW